MDRVDLSSMGNLLLHRDLVHRLVQEAVDGDDSRFHVARQHARLASLLARAYSVPPEWVAIGTGISGLIQRFAADRSGGIWYLIEPTFGLYRRACEEFGKTVVPIRSLDEITEMPSNRDSVLVVTSPAWFDGRAEARAAVEDVAKAFPGTVIIDECYVEYADESCSGMVRDHDNVIELRTFSKAWGLMGLRVGYAIGASPMVTRLHDLGAWTNSLASTSVRAAFLAITSPWYVQAVEKSVQDARTSRDSFQKRITSLGATSAPSQSNFVTVATEDSGRAATILQKRGISVQELGSLANLPGYLRITVGPSQSMEELARVLDEEGVLRA